MCKELGTIRFCSCPENLDLSKSEKEANYVWILQRVKELNTSGILGITMLPRDQLDDLTPEFIVQELNAKKLFDFEYSPQDYDSLRIERIDRAETRDREYLFGEYLNFRFFKGEWHVGQVSPFMYHLELHKNGTVEIGMSSTQKGS